MILVVGGIEAKIIVGKEIFVKYLGGKHQLSKDINSIRQVQMTTEKFNEVILLKMTGTNKEHEIKGMK